MLSGDAGIGKSRIVGAARRRRHRADWFTAVGHCVGQAGSSLAYLPFVELVGARRRWPPRRRRARARHPPEPRAPAARPRRRAPTPGTDAGRSRPTPARSPRPSTPCFTALGDAQPSLVVIEDVHWADHSSRDLITLLLTRGFTTAVGLVVTYRSDDLHRRHPLHETLAVWARIAGLEHVELAPLPDDAVRELVSGIEGAPTDAVTAAEIARRAEGNPFFAEELVASAAAGQALTGGLSRVLRARVEQLDDTAQRVLRAIALKGGQFIGHDLLSRVVGLPDETLEAALAAAVEHHVLEARWPPAYTFRHALLGETVADSLLPGERLRLHRAYAAVLAERPELAPASELARHAAAVGDLPTAVRASRAAAESAMAVGGPQEALLHFERALTWLDEDDPERDEVTLRASRAAMVAGEPIRAMDLLRDRLDHPGTAQRARCARRPARDARHPLAHPRPARRLRRPHRRGPVAPRRGGRRAPGPGARRPRAGARRPRLVRRGRRRRQRGVAARRAPRHGRRARRGAHDHGAGRSRPRRTSTRSRRTCSRSSPTSPPTTRCCCGPCTSSASLAHRRGDLPGALALYDRGAEVARRMHREWAPWGQECRLLGGLTAYELGDWDGAVAPARPRRAAGPAAGSHDLHGRPPCSCRPVGASRSTPTSSARCGSGGPSTGSASCSRSCPPSTCSGRPATSRGMLDLTEAAVRVLDAAWGEYHAVVRLAALVAGQAAALVPDADPTLRARAVAVVDELADRGRRIGELRPAVEKASRPKFERSAAESLEDTSRETWAWTARLEAEVLRLQRRRRARGPAAAWQELVDAWRASVAAFERYGHVFEAARSRARLAAALRAAGDDAGSREVAEQAREVAVRLEAKPLLAELDEVRPGGRQRRRRPSGRTTSPRASSRCSPCWPRA